MSIITRRSLFHMFDVLEWPKKRKMCEFRLCGFSLILCDNSFCAADVSLCSIRISDVSSFFFQAASSSLFLLFVELSLGWNRKKKPSYWTHIYSFFFFFVAICFCRWSRFLLCFPFTLSKFSMASRPVLSFNGLSFMQTKKNSTIRKMWTNKLCIFFILYFFPFPRTHTLAVSWAIFILCAQEILHWVVSCFNVWVKCYLS